MHAIPVRRMRFTVPDQFHPIYMAGQAAVSYNLTGIGLYVAALEPFIVKSMRRVIDRITDAELRDNLDRFCRQEAQHYMQHERFNALVIGHGYPGLEARVERLLADFEDFLAQMESVRKMGSMSKLRSIRSMQSRPTVAWRNSSSEPGTPGSMAARSGSIAMRRIPVRARAGRRATPPVAACVMRSLR